MLSQVPLFYQIAKSLSSQIWDGKGFFLKLHQLFIGHKAMFANKFRATEGGLREDKAICAKRRKKAGARNSSLCETVFHLENVLQTYKKSTVSPKPRYREEKNSFSTVLIIIAALTFASIFFKICWFFWDFFDFLASCCLNFVNFGVFGLIRGAYPYGRGSVWWSAHIFLSRIIRQLWGRRNKCK